MRKTLLTHVFLTVTALVALAQGKIKLQNDGGSPFTLSDSAHVLAADASVAGQAIDTTGPLPSGKILAIGLYWGPSSNSLMLAVNDGGPGQNPSLLNPVSGGSGVPGIMNAQSIKISGTPGGSPVFLQVRVWDASYASYEAALAAHPSGDDYFGHNNIFQETPGTSLTYPSTLQGGATTWTAVGNENPLIIALVWTAPQLTITPAGANVTLSWPSPSTGFVLEENPDFDPTNWSALVQTPTDDGTTKTVTVPASSEAKFYRLRK